MKESKQIYVKTFADSLIKPIAFVRENKSVFRGVIHPTSEKPWINFIDSNDIVGGVEAIEKALAKKIV